MPASEVTVLNDAAGLATDIVRSCQRHHNEVAEGSFEEGSKNFAEAVGRLNDDVADAEERLSHTFGFLEEAFGTESEMLVFTVELTARSASSQFINRFGSPSYYDHNEGLLLDHHQQDLIERIDGLGLQAKTSPGSPQEPEGPQKSPDALMEKTQEEKAPENRTTLTGEAREPLYQPEDLRPYYEGSQFEYGLPSLCKMTLPSNLNGKTVLDIGCRRGKGVFRLSDRVGMPGKAIGIDWSQDYIDEATRKMDRAWKDTGLPENNMEFHVGYPERLDMAGIPSESVDAIFVNSVSNLFYDRTEAFREMLRVLKPGGLIINETVLADDIRDKMVVGKAIKMGNSVQAAYDKQSFESMLSEVGFSSVSYGNAESVGPTEGALETHPVDVVESDEDVRFTALVATIRK